MDFERKSLWAAATYAVLLTLFAYLLFGIALKAPLERGLLGGSEIMQQVFESLALGFSVALQPDMLLYALIGCVVGTLVGMLPGIGPLAGISILLPLTFGLDPTKAIIMLAGIYYGSQYGGSTTSILLRIPGEAASVMTCIDGNAMAKKGRAGAALCIAAIGSFVAGTFGVLMLTLIAPPLATFALRFGPPEYTALLVLGLIFLAYMSTSSLPRTLLMAAFGLLLGTIGIDVISGHFRFSFDIPELGDGIGIVPVAVGLFGLGEILSTPSRDVKNDVALAEIPRAAADTRRVAPVRIPDRARLGPRFFHRHHSGLGAYHLQLRLLRAGTAALETSGRIRQGRGWPASPDRNRPTTPHPPARFVPMLALGIPTGPVIAVLMAALLIHGIPPGPSLVNEQPTKLF